MASADLPAPADELLGRDQLVADVVTELGRCRLVTVAGPGGVGKSRVALAAATAAAVSVEGRVWLAELGAVTDERLVITRMAAAVAARERSDDALTAIIGRIGPEPALLVVDNCEHLLAAVREAVTELLRACAGLRVLATSRAALRLRGEAVIEVGGLGLPPPAPGRLSTRPPAGGTGATVAGGTESAPAEIAAGPAVELFLRSARRRSRSFALTPSNAPAVASICRRLDGLPLALELAAMWVDVLTVEEIDRRLEDRFELLVRAPHDLPARQETLRSVLEWSYRLLDDDERELFPLLGVFPGRFRLPTVAAMTGQPEGVAARTLAGLVEKSLVQTGDGWFAMLDTTRAYAAARMNADGKSNEAMARLSALMAATASELGVRFRTDDHAGPMREVAADIDTYRACLVWLAERGRWDGFLAIAVNIWHYFNSAGAGSEARYWLELGLDEAHADAPAALRALGLSFLGDTRRRQGALVEACHLEEQSIELFTSIGEPLGAAWARTVLAGLRMALGDTAAARGALDEARETFEQARQLMQLSYVISNLGHLADREGRREEAEQLQREALAMGRSLGHPLRIGMPLINLGTCAARAGDIEAARRYWLELRELAEPIGAKLFLGVADMGLAHAAALAGDLDAAERLGRQALLRHTEAGFADGEGATLALLGSLARLRGDLGDAAELHAQALAVRSASGDIVAMAQSLAGVSQLALDVGEPARAARWFAATRRTGTRATFATCDSDEEIVTRLRRSGIGRAAVNQRDPPETQVAVDEALVWCRAMRRALRDGGVTLRAGWQSLTPRETEILILVAAGQTDRQIATELGIGEKTVGRHLTSIYRKLGARNRTDAVRIAADRPSRPHQPNHGGPP